MSAVAWNAWNDHVLDWWKHKDDPNVLFIKYEDLYKVMLQFFLISSIKTLISVAMVGVIHIWEVTEDRSKRSGREGVGPLGYVNVGYYGPYLGSLV